MYDLNYYILVKYKVVKIPHLFTVLDFDLVIDDLANPKVQKIKYPIMLSNKNIDYVYFLINVIF